MKGTRILVDGVPNHRVLKGLEQIFIDAYDALRPTGFNTVRAIAKQNRELAGCIDDAVLWLSDPSRQQAYNAIKSDVVAKGFGNLNDFITSIKTP
ncbi:MAG: hypothetical protein IPL46_23230 [Saprospiraceae bacterium]|nr:hypothetical protein [Saprospiraceae bacterium]